MSVFIILYYFKSDLVHFIYIIIARWHNITMAYYHNIIINDYEQASYTVHLVDLSTIVTEYN